MGQRRATPKKQTGKQVMAHSFPQMAYCTDTEHMRRVFQSQLPDFKEGHAQLERVVLLRSIVRPGKRCDLVYGLGYRLPGSTELNKLYLSARIYPPEVCGSYFNEYKNQTLVKPAVGPDIFWLKDLEMIVWGFPNDPELVALPMLVEPSRLFEYLKEQEAADALMPSGSAIQKATCRVVKYVPQNRCTLRHQLLFTREGAVEGETLVVFAKMFQRKICAKSTFTVIQNLYHSPLQQDKIWRIPRPLYLDETGNWFLVEGLPGEHMEPRRMNPELITLVRQCALGLACLQQTTLPLSEVRLPAAELAGFQKSLRGLQQLNGNLKDLLTFIQEEVTDSCSAPSSNLLVPNHGAFRLTQVLAHPAGPGLVDFDGLTLAHPLSDVASFMAHLLYVQAKGWLQAEEVHHLNRLFLESYCRQVPWEVNLNQLAAFVAMQLAGKHAKKILKQSKDDPLLCERLIRCASDVLTRPEELLA